MIYGIAADPGVYYPYHRLVCGDWWDESPGSPAYNTFQHVRCGIRPDFAGPEEEGLWTAAAAYRHLIPIRYNADPVVPGRGSAIFLHADWGSATHGCIAIPVGALVTVLRWLRPSAAPRIEITATAPSGHA